MNIDIVMPDLSTTGDTVKIVEWSKQPGDEVRMGETLLEVETDKGTIEVESVASGTLAEVLVDADEDAEVGQPICRIETEESSAAGKGHSGSDRAASIAGTQTPALSATASDDAGSNDASERPIQPGGAGSDNAESGGTSDRRNVTGDTRPGDTGSGGAFATESQPEPREGMFARNRRTREASKEVDSRTSNGQPGFTPMQRIVAQRMSQSKQTVPHYYLQMSANAEPMATDRDRSSGEKTVWDAYFAHAVGKALEQYPRMCIGIENGQPVSLPASSIGIAVDIDGELFVISVTEPASKSPAEVSGEIRQKVRLLRAGDSESRRIGRNAMTITNLGATGVESFVAIINPPEPSILAIGAVVPQAIPVDGSVEIRRTVTLSLSVDHRTVNGRYAADFLAAIVEQIESL